MAQAGATGPGNSLSPRYADKKVRPWSISNWGLPRNLSVFATIAQGRPGHSADHQECKKKVDSGRCKARVTVLLLRLERSDAAGPRRGDNWKRVFRPTRRSRPCCRRPRRSQLILAVQAVEGDLTRRRGSLRREAAWLRSVGGTTLSGWEAIGLRGGRSGIKTRKSTASGAASARRFLYTAGGRRSAGLISSGRARASFSSIAAAGGHHDLQKYIQDGAVPTEAKRARAAATC